MIRGTCGGDVGAGRCYRCHNSVRAKVCARLRSYTIARATAGRVDGNCFWNIDRMITRDLTAGRLVSDCRTTWHRTSKPKTRKRRITDAKSNRKLSTGTRVVRGLTAGGMIRCRSYNRCQTA